ncbi:MAG: DUF4913 domain-containing protein [Pseudolysinimonas sp.]|uniref:DUF4913 domain-containing protein n=1 Tax=Pseudolysinimonas sp. TaxID=2680009 RepID=UPI0032651518
MSDAPSAGEAAPAKPGPLRGKLPPHPATVSEPSTAAASDVPQLYFGSVDEFVREKLRYTYIRRVGPAGSYRWAAEWWRFPEAISRLDSLWRSWEALRLDGTFGMSVWWRDHADHHMRMLMATDGPFANSRDTNEADPAVGARAMVGKTAADRAPIGPLPYAAPPAGMFIDVRTLAG